MDVGLVRATTAVLEANSQRTPIGRQRGESEAPALSFGQSLTQFTLITDFNTSLLK